VSDAAVEDIGVPVEPVFYEAAAAFNPVVDAPAATAPVEVRVPPVVEVPSPVRPVADILPSVEEPAVVPPPPPASAQAPQRERRWRTWQLLAAAGIALLIGVYIGRATSSSSGRSTAVDASAPAQDAGSSSGAQPAAGDRQPRVPASAPPSPATSAPAAAVNGHDVLLNVPRQTGPLITQHFTVAGPRWTLGWAYDCTAAPGGTGAFDIKIFDGAGNPSNDGGIGQEGAKGSSVVAYTSTGERYLWVTTNCVWAIRVTT
jgi:hypothetical protein